jgi:hypothetical protein
LTLTFAKFEQRQNKDVFVCLLNTISLWYCMIYFNEDVRRV